MSRTFTQSTVLDGGQLKDNDFNDEMQGFIQEFNGSLDQHQLPLQSFDHRHLAQPTVSTVFSTVNATYSSYMTTQSYHQSEWTVPVSDPTMQYDNVLNTGFTWIKLQAFQLQATGAAALTGGAELNFDALEGMIIGNAVIDFNWFCGEATITVDGFSTSANYGNDSVIEWGVFIDDVLVSKSGYIWPRRLTLDLPFNSPVSSKPIVIDIRFRAQFIDPAAAAAADGNIINTDVTNIQKLVYQGGCIWTRNEYR